MSNRTSSSGPWSVRMPVMVGLVTLAVLVGGFGYWSVSSTLAGAIVASGTVEVDRNRQVIQHPDGGVVSEIAVDEGDTVAAGDVLIRLDPTLLQSEFNVVAGQLYEIMARKARLEAERDGAAQITLPSELSDAVATDLAVGDMIAGQQRLFEARRDSVARETDQLERRKDQIRNQIEGVTAQYTALEQQLALIGQELASQQELLDKGLAQASRVLSLQREEARLRGTMGELVATRAENEGRITEIEIEILKLGTQRREDAITRIRDLQFNEAELTEKRVSLAERLSRLDIRAPLEGIVLGLSVFAERAVIRPAEPVLYLVPQDSPLVITGQVQPQDIDEVFIGQPVTLRLPAFDTKTTPDLFGHVVLVSADAFVDDPTGATYYRVEIVMNEGELDKLDGLTLVPGMPVDSYIRTADRTPLAYLVQPFTDYFTKAFRES